jgi:hypothetical protein
MFESQSHLNVPLNSSGIDSFMNSPISIATSRSWVSIEDDPTIGEPQNSTIDQGTQCCFIEEEKMSARTVFRACLSVLTFLFCSCCRSSGDERSDEKKN